MTDQATRLEFVIQNKFEIPSYLNMMRRKLEKAINEGPVVIHMGRDVIDGAVNGDNKDHETIINDYRKHHPRK